MNNQPLFTTEIPVLVSHLNYANHLGYDAVLSILQEARMRWLRSFVNCGDENKIDGSIGWIINEISIKYQSEGFHSDVLSISLFVEDVKRSSFILKYHVLNKATNKNLCVGESNQVCFDFQKRKPSRIPQIILEQLPQDG